MGNLHETSTLTIQHLYDRVVERFRVEGNFTDICTGMNELKFGDEASDPFIDGTNVPGIGNAVVTGVSGVRANGNSGFADVELTAFRQVCIFGFDMTCVSKPIMSFRYNDETDEQVNDRAKVLQAWQSLRDQSQWNEDYVEFSYRLPGVDGSSVVHKLQGRDLEVAKKIVRGIESFDMYYPIVTCTRTSPIPFTDDLDYIGHKDTPRVPNGWDCHGDYAQLLAFVATKDTWVRTADNIITNADSSFTRRTQWTGVDALDYDLYPPLT